MKKATQILMSRRGVLQAGLVGAAAALVAGHAAAQTKLAPAAVQYQETPKGEQECDKCLQFEAPASCKIVSGKINPKGWCIAFSPKGK